MAGVAPPRYPGLGLAELGDWDLWSGGEDWAQAWPREGWCQDSCRVTRSRLPSGSLALRLLPTYPWPGSLFSTHGPEASSLAGGCRVVPTWLRPATLAGCRFPRVRNPALRLPAHDCGKSEAPYWRYCQRSWPPAAPKPKLQGFGHRELEPTQGLHPVVPRCPWTPGRHFHPACPAGATYFVTGATGSSPGLSLCLSHRSTFFATKDSERAGSWGLGRLCPLRGALLTCPHPERFGFLPLLRLPPPLSPASPPRERPAAAVGFRALPSLTSASLKSDVQASKWWKDVL